MALPFSLPPSLAVFVLSLASAAPAFAGGGEALYDVDFNPTWSFATHPTAFPPAAHFSPLIGATHSSGIQFWTPGGIASPGIEIMAETGGVFSLEFAVTQAITAGTAGQVIKGGGVFVPGSTSTTLRVTDEFPLVSLVTMIAPSPDWFVGVHDLNLLTPTGWEDSVTVELFAYDAGTDSGATFTSTNVNTFPKVPISLITGGPFTGSDSLGSFTFTRRASTFEYGCSTPPDSFVVTSGIPQMGTTVELEFSDPSGTMLLPSIVFWSASATPDVLYPCGTLFPDWGLSAPGTPGEYLVGTPFLTLRAGKWNGTPVGLSLPIPVDATLEGVPVYLQGFMIDASPRIALTSAVKLVIGS